MKKWWFLITAVILLLSTNESSATDISHLEPVEAVQILTTQDGICVRTDTGSKGYGTTLALALENLHSSAPDQIFLDTAQYLILDSQAYLPELYGTLRPACRICLAKESMDLELTARYLQFHGPEVTLLQYRAEKVELPILYSKEGRSQLVY